MSSTAAQTDTSDEGKTMAAIRRRAHQLADAAPSLTPEQVVVLRSIFAVRAGGGERLAEICVSPGIAQQTGRAPQAFRDRLDDIGLPDTADCAGSGDQAQHAEAEIPT
jgi:hypothetical protein